MPGINLSQSAMQSEQAHAIKKPLFGAQFIWSLVIVLVSLAVWGGLTFYEGRVQSEIDAVVALTNQKKQNFSSEDVNTVADFSFRLGFIPKNSQAMIDPAKMLTSLQGVVLGGVVLSKYSFDQKSKIIEMTGQADSFRTLAQQLVAFRKLSQFSQLSLGGAKAKDGVVDFSVKVTVL